LGPFKETKGQIVGALNSHQYLLQITAV